MDIFPQVRPASGHVHIQCQDPGQTLLTNGHADLSKYARQIPIQTSLCKVSRTLLYSIVSNPSSAFIDRNIIWEKSYVPGACVTCLWHKVISKFFFHLHAGLDREYLNGARRLYMELLKLCTLVWNIPRKGRTSFSVTRVECHVPKRYLCTRSNAIASPMLAKDHARRGRFRAERSCE